MNRLRRWDVKIVRTPTAAVSDRERDELLAFYRLVYDITPESLECSLNGRSVLHRVFERTTGRMVGSAAYGVRRFELPGGRRATVFNAGDIVLLPEARGVGLMEEMGLTGVLREILEDPWTPKYLFSVALTYKLYRAVSRMFRDFWPRFDAPTPPEILALMDDAGRHFYQDVWTGPLNPVVGDRRGNSDSGLLEVPAAALNDPTVRFFVERNPTHLEGTALPLLTRLDARNLTAVLRSLVSHP
jgi:hypothetical protein